jgi:hypothetical protein
MKVNCPECAGEEVSYLRWSSIFKSVDEEIIKLIAMINHHEGDLIPRVHILEKLNKILNKQPLMFHPLLDRRAKEEIVEGFNEECRKHMKT